MSDFFLNPNTDNEPIINNVVKMMRSLDPEKRWHVKIKLYDKKRSLQQQAYYWSVMLVYIKNWVYETHGIAASEDAIHEEMKGDYCPYTEKQGLHDVIKVYKSTTNLTTKEFTEMTDKIIADFANKGLYIPPPDKHWKQNTRNFK